MKYDAALPTYIGPRNGARREMKIEYDLTPEDWGDFGEYCARTSPEFRRARRRSMVSGVLSIMIACVILWIMAGSLGSVVVVAVFGFAGLFLWPDRLVSHARSHMRERERPCLSGRHVLEATPDALVAKCDVTESSTRWAGVHHIGETTRHVFVMLNDVQGYVIPKARIRSGDLDQFASEAQKYASAPAQSARLQ